MTGSFPDGGHAHSLPRRRLTTQGLTVSPAREVVDTGPVEHTQILCHVRGRLTTQGLIVSPARGVVGTGPGVSWTRLRPEPDHPKPDSSDLSGVQVSGLVSPPAISPAPSSMSGDGRGL